VSDSRTSTATTRLSLHSTGPITMMPIASPSHRSLLPNPGVSRRRNQRTRLRRWWSLARDGIALVPRGNSRRSQATGRQLRPPRQPQASTGEPAVCHHIAALVIAACQGSCPATLGDRAQVVPLKVGGSSPLGHPRSPQVNRQLGASLRGSTGVIRVARCRPASFSRGRGVRQFCGRPGGAGRWGGVCRCG
jgi:hypothetical protein